MSLWDDMRDDLQDFYTQDEMRTMTSPTPGSADHLLTLPKLEAAKSVLRKMLSDYERIQANCTTCEHYNKPNGRCYHFDAEPPLEFVSSHGQCEAWLHDGAPF